jgi:hypothetical protein
MPVTRTINPHLRELIMIQMAIADVLGTVVSNWYSDVANWRAPGDSSPSSCGICLESSFRAITRAELWPHDVMHPLTVALLSTVRHVTVWLEEEHASGLALWDPTERQPANDRVAEYLVGVALTLHADDMRDVLEKCVTPRVDEHIGLQLKRGLREFEDRAGAIRVP